MSTTPLRRLVRTVLATALAAASLSAMTATAASAAPAEGARLRTAVIALDVPYQTGATYWTSVWAATPASSYWTTNRDTMRVGYDTTSSAPWRSLLQANTTQLIGKTIVSASVRITLDHSWSCSATPVQLWGLSGTLNGTTPVTWSNSSAWWTSALSTKYANANGSGGCGAIQPDVVVQFDGTGVVQAVQSVATSGGYQYAFGLRAPNESAPDQWKKFKPGTAYLTVTYSE